MAHPVPTPSPLLKHLAIRTRTWLLRRTCDSEASSAAVALALETAAAAAAAIVEEDEAEQQALLQLAAAEGAAEAPPGAKQGEDPSGVLITFLSALGVVAEAPVAELAAAAAKLHALVLAPVAVPNG